jgi:hypothetical protein
MTRSARLVLVVAAFAAGLAIVPCDGWAHATTTKESPPQLAGEWKDNKDQTAKITQDGDKIELRVQHDFFSSNTVDKSDWVFTGTVNANGFELKHVKNHGNDQPGIPVCAENQPEKYPLKLTGTLSDDKNTIHATLSGETFAYDGCKLTKEEPKSLKFDLSCAIDEKLIGWRFQGACPSDPANGVKQLTVTPPGASSGTTVTLPGGDSLGYALPVKDKSHLFLPIVLPDLSISVGGVNVTAYENTIGKDGVTIGTGVIELQKYNTFALVHDLEISPDLHVKAGSLLVSVYNASLEADGIDFQPGKGLSTQSVTVGLPDILGGGEVGISGFGIDAQGAIHGTIDKASFSIGDIKAAFAGAKFTDGGFSLNSVTLNLPAYLGGATFDAKGVKYNASDDSISVTEAGGALHFNVGNRLLIDANVRLTLDPGGGWGISGAGSVEIPDSPTPFFKLHAELTIHSVDCKPYPSRDCPKPAFLIHAYLGIEGRPVPIGQTGIAISGIEADIKAIPHDAYRDANGDIQGVTYRFSGALHLLTAADGGKIFHGKLKATITTDGNVALVIQDAIALGVIHVEGGVCARFVVVPGDDICDGLPIPETYRSDWANAGPGAMVAGKVSAELHYKGWAGTIHASLGGDAFASFSRAADGTSYLRGHLGASMQVVGGGWLLPDVEGKGELSADVGRFNRPGGGTTVGVKGKLTATLKAKNANLSLEYNRSIFIDKSGAYTEENVDSYTPVGPSRKPSSALGGNGFTVAPGDKQTFITASWLTGSPTFTLEGPHGLHIVAHANGPTIAVTGPGASGVYLLDVKTPRSLALFMPKPVVGDWTVRATGGGGIGVHVQGNKPTPTLTVEAPAAGQTLHATVAAPTQTIRGTLHGADPNATVTLYAGRTGCAGPLLASRVRAGGGMWSFDWNTAGLQSGSYHVYAVLDNGTGPLVSVCSTGTVSVERPAHPAGPKHLTATLKQQAVVAAWQAPDAAGTARGYVIRWRTAGRPPGTWHPVDAGASLTFTLRVPPNTGGYEIGVAAYDAAGRPGPYATIKAAGPKAPKRSKAQRARKTAVASAPIRFLDSAAAAADCAAPSGNRKKEVTVPIFRVTSTTPNIAYNDAAAINGKDPSDGTKARWVQNGKYAPYPHKAPGDLQYGRLSYSNGCVKLSKTNRQAACGKDPFKEGKSPGPPDGKKINPKTGAQMNGKSTSCDEYPFASSKQGGATAIIRGVPLAENSQQGRDLSKFLRENANALVLLDGLFQVCVETKGTRAGDCITHTETVKVP